MTPFFKYILINLLFFILLMAVGYRLLKPRSVGKAMSSSQTEEEILNEAQLSDTLYRTYKLALKGTDPIALVQAKGNFQVKMMELKQRSLTAAPLDSIFWKMGRNYRSLISLNEDKMKNQKNLDANKQSYKDLIEQLTKSNERLDRDITIILSQSPPQPAIPK